MSHAKLFIDIDSLDGAQGIVHDGPAGIARLLVRRKRQAARHALAQVESAVDFDRRIERTAIGYECPNSGDKKGGSETRRRANQCPTSREDLG